MDDSGCKSTGLSPEAAQDDHGSGEGDKGRAVADCVEGLHRQVVIILEQGRAQDTQGSTWNQPLPPQDPHLASQTRACSSTGRTPPPSLPSLHSCWMPAPLGKGSVL